ncbi:MAG TPA: GNAT family N-acetyltransferase [Candidatus Eisenbacteria bacterium]
MSGSREVPRRSGRLAGVRESLRSALRVQRRLVYGFDLSADPPPAAPGAPVSFSWEPPGADGDEWFHGEREGRRVYSMRVSTDQASIRRLVACATVEAPAAFLYDCATTPDSRGMGIYPAALAAALRDLKARGARAAYIRVHRANAASIRGIEKAGFRLLGEVAHVTVLGRSLRPFAWRRAPGEGR